MRFAAALMRATVMRGNDEQCLYDHVQSCPSQKALVNATMVP